MRASRLEKDADPRAEAAGGVLSRSPLFTPLMNASHPARVKARTGPPGSLESRTATVPEGSSRTSTQLELEKLYVLLRHPSMIMILAWGRGFVLNAGTGQVAAGVGDGGVIVGDGEVAGLGVAGAGAGVREGDGGIFPRRRAGRR